MKKIEIPQRPDGTHSDLEYTLIFALTVIEQFELQDTESSDNWHLGRSLENEIRKLE